ncbi:MAG TPA: SRPBCC family protein [Anaerolineales bacterium]|nr:SRPBCC family protein [Anaerolineales bacterium]
MKFDLSTDIYRPLTQVFAFVTTPENDFHWQYGTIMSDKISRGEMGVGTLFRVVGHLMGRRVESVYEVTEFEANKRYGFKSLSGLMDLHTLYTFEIMKGSTRIYHSAQISLSEPSKSNPTMAEKTIKKEYRENLGLLKDILESSRVEKSLERTVPVSKRRRSDFR